MSATSKTATSKTATSKSATSKNDQQKEVTSPKTMDSGTQPGEKNRPGKKKSPGSSRRQLEYSRRARRRRNRAKALQNAQATVLAHEEGTMETLEHIAVQPETTLAMPASDSTENGVTQALEETVGQTAADAVPSDPADGPGAAPVAEPSQASTRVWGTDPLRLAALGDALLEDRASGAFISLVLYDAAGEVVLEDQVHGSLLDQRNGALALLKNRYLPEQNTRTGGAFLAGAFVRDMQDTRDSPDADAAAQQADAYKAAGQAMTLVLSSLREALDNALCHRDYGDSRPITICVFPNRIELGNPCLLPVGMSAKKLLPAGVSLPGNSQLLDLFVRAEMATGTGASLGSVRSSWKQVGLPVPKIVLTAENAGETPEPAGQGRVDTFTLRFACVPPKVKEGPRRVLPATKAKASRLLGLLQNNPHLSMRRMAELTGLGISAVRNALRYLRDIGLLEREGNRRSGSWKMLPWAKRWAEAQVLEVLHGMPGQEAVLARVDNRTPDRAGQEQDLPAAAAAAVAG